MSGFDWGQVLSSVLAALVLGFLASSRKWVRRELVDPVKDLRTDFKKHVRQDKTWQKKTEQRLRRYEQNAVER